ncbi:MAG: DAK2 domain-containing protein [Ruminococcaceae bacterium]|nr:DAK2 domain-containing protein [Oscillospiraceae bacterium]
MLIDGHLFYQMLVSAANALDNSKTPINNMNVFPVPDGDTGINMTLTMSTIKALSDFEGTLSDCAEKTSSLILRAARGNSGAILSLFFRGVAKSFRGLECADSADVARAFKRGTEEAYKAVMNPTEGTILTVMRVCAEEAEAQAKSKKGDVVGLFTCLVRSAEDILAKTPDMLPVLKEVNLVDAGGYGFVVVLSGMLAALRHTPVEAIDEQEISTETAFEEVSTADIRFAYCTECVVEKAEHALGEGSADELKAFLYEIGDSTVFIDEEDIIKLHVHTNNPGLVLEKALAYGALLTVKIENMRKQHSEIIDRPAVEKPRKATTPVKARIAKTYGFVSVCMGRGVSDIFKDLGVDHIIYGGQTMNPSTQDIIDAVNLTPAECIFVLPNNKNIHMVAEQAAKLIRDKQVRVLPTRNIPQGICAMLAFDPEVGAEDNMAAMSEALTHVTAMSVTRAVRDTVLDGAYITSGQYLGLVNGNIQTVGDDADSVMRELAKQAEGASFVTLLYGEGATIQEAEHMAVYFRAAAGSMTEINVINGGQPLYPFIISIEV